jgi:ankyrin repeat protein
MRDIHDAAWNGDLQQVQTLLEQNRDLANSIAKKVGHPDEHATLGEKTFCEPLHLAAAAGHKEVTELLLAYDANANSPSGDGYTPLHLAAHSGHRDVAELLLTNSRPVDPIIVITCGKCRKAYTLGINAVSMTSSELGGMMSGFVGAITERGSPDLMVGQTLTLDTAQLHSDRATILRLGPNGGWTCQECYYDNTWDPQRIDASSYYAPKPSRFSWLSNIFNRQPIRPKILLNRAEVDVRGRFGKTPMHLAAKSNRPGMVELLLDHKADVNAQDISHNCPLYIAALYGCADVAMLLLNHGAKVDAKNKSDETSLFIASSSGWREVAEVLLTHKADVNARCRSYSPLHVAKNKDITELLLAHGADVNAKSENGNTPLRMSYGKDGVEELLRKNGAQGPGPRR